MSRDDATGSPEVIEFAGVRFGPEHIVEVEDGQVMITVSRRDIEGIRLRDGFHSAHPLLQILAGAVTTAIGALPTWHFANWLVHGGTFVTIEATLNAFVFVGPWLIVNALKRGPYLEVRTPAGTRKVAFDRKPEPAQLEKFFARAEFQHGYKVERLAL